MFNRHRIAHFALAAAYIAAALIFCFNRELTHALYASVAALAYLILCRG